MAWKMLPTSTVYQSTWSSDTKEHHANYHYAKWTIRKPGKLSVRATGWTAADLACTGVGSRAGGYEAKQMSGTTLAKTIQYYPPVRPTVGYPLGLRSKKTHLFHYFPQVWTIAISCGTMYVQDRGRTFSFWSLLSGKGVSRNVPRTWMHALVAPV